MDKGIENAIVSHSQNVFPRESCGLIVDVDGTPQYWPCENLAVGSDNFVLSPSDYAKAESSGNIIAVVHSHPNGPAEFSQGDKVACEASGLPWHMVTIPDISWHYMEPSGYQAPLIGRVWCHGVLDCYAIIRDWYKLERGIILPDFERHDDWWHKGQNLYTENFAKAGFRRVIDEPMQVGDVLLMQVMANVPNHAAILLDNNLILHHLHGRLSCRDVYGGYWRKNTTHILRYDNQT